MVWTPATRLTAIIASAAVFIALFIVDALTELNAAPYLEILTYVAAVVFGVGLAAGPGKSGGGAAAVLALFALISLGGCCDTMTQRPIASAYDLAIDAAEAQVGENDNRGWRAALTSARGVGLALDTWTRACQIVEGDGGWRAMLQLALEEAQAIAALITGAADGPADTAAQLPEELVSFIDLAEGQLE